MRACRHGAWKIPLMPFTRGSVSYSRFRLAGDAPARPDDTVLATVLDGPAVMGASLAVDGEGARDLGLTPTAWPEVVAAATDRLDGRSGTAR